MSEKEIEEIKKQLREEMKNEIEKAIDNNRNTTAYREYMNNSIIPLLEEKFERPKEKYNFINALNTIARLIAKKRHVYRITDQDIEKFKDLFLDIIERI